MTLPVVMGRFVALAVITLVVATCGGLTAIVDSAPSFEESTALDRSFPVSSVTCTLALPAATGGNGALSYSLTPRVDDWAFDPVGRILSVRPTRAGTWHMRYRVEDGDENTEDSDAAELTFTITVKDPAELAPAAEGIASAYRGCGNQVFSLNPEGDSLVDELYTLLLDATYADVYLIATNTTTDAATATIQPLNLSTPPPATIRHAVDPAAVARHFHADRPPHPDPSRTEFDPSSLVSSPLDLSRRVARQPPRHGDAFTFWDTFPEQPRHVPATARRVVTDGTTSAVFWVEDSHWGTCEECINQAFLDVIADDFLTSGTDNDLHDWVTAIFGAPWGPHHNVAFRQMIPPESVHELHILLLHTEEEYGGYHTSEHTFLRAAGARHSNERLMFFVNIRYYVPEEKDIDEFQEHRANLAITLAHEYQHMIRHYQKSVRHDFVPVIESWLDEMASRMTEEFVSYKLMADGLRVLPYDDPTAGNAPIESGQYALYNYYNYLQGAYWEFDPPRYRYYATNFALGAYLAYTYGGAPLMGAIAQNEQSGTASIEAAIVELGHPPIAFEEILTNWAVANLLSDDTNAPYPYRYNSGAWSTSVAGGMSFRLGSVNLFNYRFHYEDRPDAYHDGPYFFSVETFNAAVQAPLSNRYVDLGKQTGMLQLRLNAPAGSRITVVVKG